MQMEGWWGGDKRAPWSICKEEVRVLMSTHGLVRHGEADRPVLGRSV